MKVSIKPINDFKNEVPKGGAVIHLRNNFDPCFQYSAPSEENNNFMYMALEYNLPEVLNEADGVTIDELSGYEISPFNEATDFLSQFAERLLWDKNLEINEVFISPDDDVDPTIVGTVASAFDEYFNETDNVTKDSKYNVNKDLKKSLLEYMQNSRDGRINSLYLREEAYSWHLMTFNEYLDICPNFEKETKNNADNSSI